MIQKQTRLIVADNSGAKEVMCIHIVGSTRKRYAYLGDLIVCAVKSATPGAAIKKGDVVTAVIIRVRKEFRRADGSYIKFGDNAALIVKKTAKGELELASTRILGPVARELRNRSKKIDKLASLAPELV